MAKNIIEKIWEKHIVASKDGYPDVFAIDLCLLHEVTSPQAFDELRERGLEVYDSSRCVATVDHIISTTPDRELLTHPKAREQVTALRKNCEEFGVRLLDMGSGNQGVVHVVAPELGLIQPGMTVVCGDSHTATHGAFGAIAFGIGTTEVGHVLATSCVLRHRPKTMKVEFKGKLHKGVTAKDVILKLIQDIGVGGATGHIIEYCGEVIRNFSMEERMTICNMSIECGARAGLVAPDETTFEYLKNCERVSGVGDLIENWKSFVSDKGCEYDKVVKIDVNDLFPMVTWGTNPSQSIEVCGVVPSEDEKALEYTRLKPGQSIEGIEVDYVFIGSCTNGRISDLRVAADVLKGKKVADGVRVIVVPGSEKVYAEAVDEGLDKIFEDVGAEFRLPGCSLCLSMSGEVIPPGKRCASTSNRNFIGRQGKDSITHLVSPLMAAAAAITGKIVDVSKFI